MKYFLDTEFLEGSQKSLFGKSKPTIDLISIGIVSEDNRQYYAISKDFNLKEAWNRYDWKQKKVNDGIPGAYKDYWIRENVLKPIWEEKCKEDFSFKNSPMTPYGIESLFTYSNFKKLLNKYGKTNKQIAEEVKEFVTGDSLSIEKTKYYNVQYDNIEFYGYYCDYDWVVFCWLFGKMINLPKGFPMYCIDLKQILDELQELENKGAYHMISCGEVDYLNIPLKERKDYPKQTNEHNALADARWNKKLYEFLENI